jgi:hypothetical protein
MSWPHVSGTSTFVPALDPSAELRGGDANEVPKGNHPAERLPVARPTDENRGVSMDSIAVGDVVTHENAAGWYGTVVRFDIAGDLVVLCEEQSDEPVPWGKVYCKKVDFPIAADKDPWRDTAPRVSPCNWCRASAPPRFKVAGLPFVVCNLHTRHSGHHIARDTTAGDMVLARWPQEAKPGPVVGMDVVCTKEGAAFGVVPGARMRVDAIGDHYFHASRGMTKFTFPCSQFGIDVIPAADWDAQQKRDTIPAPPLKVYDGESGQRLRTEPPPEGRFDFLAPTIAARELFTTRLAIALFEADNAGTLARVADDGRGGIGTAAVRERLVWGSAECQREAYMLEAAALLKRAGELS